MDEGCFERASMRDHQYYYQNNFPSFSSTLLDSIYRSIDEAGGSHPHHQQQRNFFHQEPNTALRQDGALKGQEHQRAYEGEKWMDKKGSCKVDVQWNSVANLRRSPRSFRNSSSSSSDSSSNRGGFSSSESDYTSHSESKSSSSCYSIKKLKPIRTSMTVDRPNRPRVIDTLGGDDNFRVHQVNRPNVHKQEGGVVKAKSKALKIYTEFKRASGNNNKQPVSPGAKLASFLNSLFNAKKGKVSARYDENFPSKVPKSGYSSACSSASSFSRSCLSKTPSSRGKFTSDGTKRSVRFCPVNVIVDEDNRPCGQETVLHEDHRELDSRKSAACAAKHQESGKMAIKNFKETIENRGSRQDEDRENEEDDDGASCASSDLFELENLSGIGIGGGYRYSEELPVYETTNLNTIRAVANGLIV